ncbi:hypothetical protein HOY80DRAFT_36441 [Tuber brumale]|nr:hypothetical protein HOY80DRAFT_36441 [Tuber brumale]
MFSRTKFPFLGNGDEGRCFTPVHFCLFVFLSFCLFFFFPLSFFFFHLIRGNINNNAEFNFSLLCYLLSFPYRILLPCLAHAHVHVHVHVLHSSSPSIPHTVQSYKERTSEKVEKKNPHVTTQPLPIHPSIHPLKSLPSEQKEKKIPRIITPNPTHTHS